MGGTTSRATTKRKGLRNYPVYQEQVQGEPPDQYNGLKPEVLIYLLMTTHDLRETMCAKLLDLFRAQYSEKSVFSFLPLDCLNVIRDYYLLLHRAENGWPFKVTARNPYRPVHYYTHLLPFDRLDVIDVIEPVQFSISQRCLARHPHGKRIGFLTMDQGITFTKTRWLDINIPGTFLCHRIKAITLKKYNSVLPIEMSFLQGESIVLVAKYYLGWYEAERESSKNKKKNWMDSRK